MRNIQIEEIPEERTPEKFNANVTELSLEDVALNDKYVTYHCVVTATS